MSTKMMIFFEKFLNKRYGALSVAWFGVPRTGPPRRKKFPVLPVPARPEGKNSQHSPYRPAPKEKIPRTPRTVRPEQSAPVATLDGASIFPIPR